MVYTTKFYLLYQDRDEMNYQQFRNAMFDVQQKVRKFKNMASSEYFSYMMRQIQFKEEHGRYPTDEELIGYKIRTHLYHKAVDIVQELNTGNASCVSEDVCKHFKSRKKDIFAGRVAIPSYKGGQPISIHKNSIRLFEEDGKSFITLSLFSNIGKNKYGLQTGKCKFEVWHKCSSSLPIIHRCVDGEYKVCTSQINYDKRKGMWEFALSYEFCAEKHKLDPKKILGIDLGIAIPIVAAISGEQKRWFFNGNEIQAFREKTEAMRRQMSKSRVQAGNGAVGHGRDTRMKAVDRIGHRIANFRNTKNDAWSREIVNIAVKNGCGTIQMEDLTGITSGNQSRFLKGWTYYDLQQKIRYKAMAAGIDVIMINPEYTSQRCSKCGCIHAENRKSQSEFSCVECGYSENADYNAAKNIATENIENIIQTECEGKVNRKAA